MSELHITDFPADLLARLEAQAGRHQRTVRDELVTVLRDRYNANGVEPAEQLRRIRQLRDGLPFEARMDDILTAIDQGRG